MGRSRSSILDLAHSLNRLRNQVLRDRSGDQIQRKERSRRMGRRRSYYLRALGGGIGKFLGGWYAIGLMIELILHSVLRLCPQLLSS